MTDMWHAICDVFEKHTILNKVNDRRRLYTAEMNETESILQLSNLICQLRAALKSMNQLILDDDMDMSLLYGLPDSYVPIIAALTQP